MRNEESDRDVRVTKSGKKIKVHDTVSKDLADKRKELKNKRGGKVLKKK